MKTAGQAQLVRVYVGESDRWEGRPLYEAIVRAAREHGLAGSTVFRGVEGYGTRSQIHTVKVLHLSEDLPVVVEIVDVTERIQPFLATLDKMMTEGMITLEDVNVLIYRRDASEEPSQDDELELEDPAASQQEAPAGEFAKATEPAQKIIAIAREEANRSHRGFVDSVDVLLAMIREPKGLASRVLRDLRIDAETVKQCLREQVSRESPTDQFLKVLDDKSSRAADWLEQQEIGPEHLLLALCEVRPSAATDILTRLGAQPREVCRDVLKILRRKDDWQRWLADHPDM